MRGTALALTVAAAGVGLVGAATGIISVRNASSDTPATVTPRTQAPAEARALSRGFASAARALQPSVVRLDVEIEQPKLSRLQNRRGGGQQVPPELAPFMERFFDFGGGEGGEGMPGMPGPDRGTGSGVIIDAAGNIMTNGHVVNGATKVTVTLFDGRELSAKVIGRDSQTDVAVVRIEKAPPGLTAARKGDSDKVEVGEWVLAIGSPLGMSQTVTAGIISSKGRVRNNQVAGARVREYIQTDAKINPGNSGGPLVNLEGEVIGINTFIQVGAGGAYGFAIPINQAQRVAQTILKDGRVRYAYLGLNVGDLHDADPAVREKLPKGAPDKAALVAAVTPGGPASKAGFRAGDVITRIDDQKIEGGGDVVNYVSSRSIGSRVTVAFLRDGRVSSAQVTLGELPDKDAHAAEAVEQQKVGVALQSLTPDLARSLGLDPNSTGAVVAEIVPGSRAAQAGLQEADVIVEVNRKPVTTAEETIAALKAGGSGAQLVRVRRGGSARFVTIPAAK